MTVTVTSETAPNGIALVRLGGRLDAGNLPTVRDRTDALDASGATRVVIDLTDVSFLDSAGLALLVTVLKHSRQAGGDTRLVWPANENTRRILRMTHFDRVFDIAQNADEALGRF